MTTRITGTLNPWGPVSQANRVHSYQSGRICGHSSATPSSPSTTPPGTAPSTPRSRRAGGGVVRHAPSGKSRASSAAPFSRPATRLASTAATGAGWRPSPGANAQPSAPRAASRRRRPSRRWPRLPTSASPSGAPPDCAAGRRRALVTAVAAAVGLTVHLRRLAQSSEVIPAACRGRYCRATLSSCETLSSVTPIPGYLSDAALRRRAVPRSSATGRRSGPTAATRSR